MQNSISNKPTICAVVVTYNRKELLLECLNSIVNQNYPVDSIVIIDNCSNDGTTQKLVEAKYISTDKTIVIKNGISIFYKKTSMNIGGAGGFNIGIKEAFSHKFDFIWLMDDDTIPHNSTLSELIKSYKISSEKLKSPIGFVCSKVLHTDHTVHIMNIPTIHSIYKNDSLPFNTLDEDDVLVAYSCSFVSVLITFEAIQFSGLPYKEYFIWYDDVEFTSRISDQGFIGIYSMNSTVVHKTPFNYGANILSASVNDLWKFKYGIRNSLHALKRKNFKLFLFVLIKKAIFDSIFIYKNRKNHNFLFAKSNFISVLSSLFFNPEKEFI
ncbi:glycosyltransferase [Sulfuricurvum sp.]|uniref:glycosyltransferase n=1 Tax=Sulfuricurvum sp. TaxID=2025608 RepID=UPI00262955EA|nr:glycosyltransferase [Sulfuricurvum sp.]MDD2267528.1 glycosyltransferase [Sulfuricurvum sp.]MDD2783682.1 glycosyltransferase [Sulfuricurvum sp.]